MKSNRPVSAPQSSKSSLKSSPKSPLSDFLGVDLYPQSATAVALDLELESVVSAFLNDSKINYSIKNVYLGNGLFLTVSAQHGKLSAILERETNGEYYMGGMWTLDLAKVLQFGWSEVLKTVLNIK